MKHTMIIGDFDSDKLMCLLILLIVGLILALVRDMIVMTRMSHGYMGLVQQYRKLSDHTSELEIEVAEYHVLCEHLEHMKARRGSIQYIVQPYLFSKN